MPLSLRYEKEKARTEEVELMEVTSNADVGKAIKHLGEEETQNVLLEICKLVF